MWVQKNLSKTVVSMCMELTINNKKINTTKAKTYEGLTDSQLITDYLRTCSKMLQSFSYIPSISLELKTHYHTRSVM